MQYNWVDASGASAIRTRLAHVPEARLAKDIVGDIVRAHQSARQA
jgi:hypothetical protein